MQPKADMQPDLDEDSELNYLLINFTGDTAKEMVQLREGELGVEIWRALCHEHDPQTGTAGAQRSTGGHFGEGRARGEARWGARHWSSIVKRPKRRAGAERAATDGAGKSIAELIK